MSEITQKGYTRGDFEKEAHMRGMTREEYRGFMLSGTRAAKLATVRRDGRVSLRVDDEEPPFHFAMVEGEAEATLEDLDKLRWSTRIGGRYMGADAAEVREAERRAG